MGDETNLDVIRTLNTQHDKVHGKISAIESKIAQLEEKRKQLELTRDMLRKNIRKWHRRRPFAPFLRLPLEIREMIYACYVEIGLSFHVAYNMKMALVSKPIREEFLSWLGWNRPLFWVDICPVIQNAYRWHGQSRYAEQRGWSRVPTQMLRRVRMIDIGNGPPQGISTLLVASGEMRLNRPPTPPGRQKAKVEMRWDAFQLVAAMIAKEGTGLKRSHLMWISAASRGEQSLADLEAEMQYEIDNGPRVRTAMDGLFERHAPRLCL
ncbi:hypothetical protein CB0940_08643 [Cercospora beticola]|uniref:Uncharacterized protein n=1 Tax=Cercospora beticola TaxID=122368 RepID=A0A2G5HQ18_CERBT|nr:hypothetical protein CB0940_08643 [Cercospora beticola]PIA94625.1 hypothetical protein CB0940_08643 [Cercospora beticola]WPB05224.1 hypothetical protein RHO25_009875 [Cercospora beticola]CAK1365013.1 unnamed protein product [Cercospora beticola]